MAEPGTGGSSAVDHGFALQMPVLGPIATHHLPGANSLPDMDNAHNRSGCLKPGSRSGLQKCGPDATA